MNRRTPEEVSRPFSWRIYQTRPGPSKPFESKVRAAVTGTFLRVQRWEAGKWLDFPLPTKTDQSGQFVTQAEFGQPGRYRLRVLDPDSGVTFVVVIKG